jgi:hypothetical protein
MSVPPTVDPLSVTCPICDAQAGQQCQTADDGWIQEMGLPHVYRLKIAAENAK